MTHSINQNRLSSNNLHYLDVLMRMRPFKSTYDMYLTWLRTTDRCFVKYTLIGIF